jgi:hypothetical protein
MQWPARCENSRWVCEAYPELPCDAIAKVKVEHQLLARERAAEYRRQRLLRSGRAGSR